MVSDCRCQGEETKRLWPTPGRRRAQHSSTARARRPAAAVARQASGGALSVIKQCDGEPFHKMGFPQTAWMGGHGRASLPQNQAGNRPRRPSGPAVTFALRVAGRG